MMYISFIILFIVKLIDQILRTSYLITIKKAKNNLSIMIVGVHQLLHIYIIIYIVNEYSIPNVIALVSSTMLGTYLINTRYNKESKESE